MKVNKIDPNEYYMRVPNVHPFQEVTSGNRAPDHNITCELARILVHHTSDMEIWLRLGCLRQQCATSIILVFSGCAKEWKAFSKWNVSNGGLDYLQVSVWMSLKRNELVGSSIVEAMLSRSAPVFYGDIRAHERVPLPFSTFIGYCKDLLQCEDDGEDPISQLRKHEPTEVATHQGDFATGEESPKQIYLAQVLPLCELIGVSDGTLYILSVKFKFPTHSILIPFMHKLPLDTVSIVNTENEEKSQLECLRDDIETPAFLENKILASINLWMNNAKSRSSTHYDPHHNLLCIISGCKQVVLWPPSACPFLYPLPVYGESSNHSAIPLENTNFSLYPRAKSIVEYSRKVTLHAGDALFIPEGWFHQVDSEDLTIAVNFWWQSDMMSSMPEHMDAYYLRRILKRLTDKEMDRMLSMPSTSKVNHVIGASGQSSNENAGGEEKLEPGFSLRELEPHELRSLHELISLVHEQINCQPADQSACREDVVKKLDKANLHNLEDDPIANTVWNLEPHVFQIVFLTMAVMILDDSSIVILLPINTLFSFFFPLHLSCSELPTLHFQHNFPRTLEAFVLHALSPVGVEVLTRKFEQMDQRIVPDERSQFYQKFYSVFDNQFSAMDALLNGKESFACQAFNNVLVQYLGVNLDGPKPSLQ
ncbi:hypothetical protein SASPL_103219 [Salvia splendens]|uniref:JmjC domain-containing protein n=1 Tax=Salvia splendens TaxID=180675 RepID=A0A8X9ADG7_SALSN|nr:hypothetical protein SASPL_103219 [Salvia splendens]